MNKKITHRRNTSLQESSRLGMWGAVCALALICGIWVTESAAQPQNDRPQDNLRGGAERGPDAAAQGFAPPDYDDAPPPGGHGGPEERGPGRGWGGRRRPFADEGGGRGMGEHMGQKGQLGNALSIMNNFHGALEDPHQAVGLALITLKNYYHREGDQKRVIPVLEDLLKTTQDQGARNIMLFTLRQVYQEERDKEQFLAITNRILKENIDTLNAKKK